MLSVVHVIVLSVVAESRKNRRRQRAAGKGAGLSEKSVHEKLKDPKSSSARRPPRRMSPGLACPLPCSTSQGEDWKNDQMRSGQFGRVVSGAGFRRQSARAWAQTPQLSLEAFARLLRPTFAPCFATSLHLGRTLAVALLWHCSLYVYSREYMRDEQSSKTVWPSGLRRWLKAPFRKGVGSNPTAVN